MTKEAQESKTVDTSQTRTGGAPSSRRHSQFETISRTLGGMRKQVGSKSRVGAVILLLLSASMLFVSYRFPNIVLEVNSVVAFIAGVMLLFKDSSHSVQLRVVDRILKSNGELEQSIAPASFFATDYSYVLLGSRASDVVVVPSSEVAMIKDLTDPELSKMAGTLKTIVPPGRALAELFEREVSMENVSVNDLLSHISTVISGGFELADSVSVKQDGDDFEFDLIHPTLRNTCARSTSIKSNVVGCPICSLISTVMCHVTQRETIAHGCEYDERKDVTIMKLNLGVTLGNQQGRKE